MQRNHFPGFVASLLSLVAALTPPAQAAANLLFNGSLDLCQPVEITPGFYLPKPLGWANVGARTIAGPYEGEMSSEPWAGPAPTPVTTNGTGAASPNGCGGADCGVFFRPFSGNGVNGDAIGHLYQDNPAKPGLTYVVTVWAGAEAQALLQAELGIDFLNATTNLVGGASLDLNGAGLFATNGQPFQYKQFTVSATAPSNTASVRVRASMYGGTANPVGGGQAFVVDDFILAVRPLITAISTNAPGITRQITGLGATNRTYVIQSAPGLIAPNVWSNLGSTNANAAGVVSFQDSAPGITNRYYRLLDP